MVKRSPYYHIVNVEFQMAAVRRILKLFRKDAQLKSDCLSFHVLVVNSGIRLSWCLPKRALEIEVSNQRCGAWLGIEGKLVQDGWVDAFNAQELSHSTLR